MTKFQAPRQTTTCRCTLGGGGGGGGRICTSFSISEELALYMLIICFKIIFKKVFQLILLAIKRRKRHAGDPVDFVAFSKEDTHHFK